MKRTALAFVALSSLTGLACDRQVQAKSAANQDTARPVTSLTIDSILPTGEALRRFQAGMSPVSGLGGSIRSRDTLVRRFVKAIESGDTAALGSLVVSKPEYAFLYFPTSVYTRKPYELPPDIAWLLSEQSSLKGSTRLTRRLGGETLGFRGYECSAPVTEGENRFWRTCHVTYIDPGSGLPVTKGLFGAIMERAGDYKFLSYSNDF